MRPARRARAVVIGGAGAPLPARAGDRRLGGPRAVGAGGRAFFNNARRFGIALTTVGAPDGFCFDLALYCFELVVRLTALPDATDLLSPGQVTLTSRRNIVVSLCEPGMTVKLGERNCSPVRRDGIQVTAYWLYPEPFGSLPVC